MAGFSFAQMNVDWEVGRKLNHVVNVLENQMVPGNANQRLFPQGEGTDLNELKKLLRPGQDPVAEEFDFELGEVLTYADAVRQCEEGQVNITDVMTAKGGRLYFDTNLGDAAEGRRDVEISKPENADPHVELSKCRFFDNARSVIDWKSSLPGLKNLARERKYTAEMVQTCLKKLVSEYCKPHFRIIEDMTHNQIANYLLSTENNIDRSIYKKRELNELTRMPGQELRIPLTMARNLIDKIYPADVADNAAARSSTWRTAIISFLPDIVAMPLLEKIRMKIEDCNPMSDEDIYDFAIMADERAKSPLPCPLKYGRQVGASPVLNQIHFNSVETGFHSYGVPMEGYGNPYQAYQAYPLLRDDPPRRQAAPMMGQPHYGGHMAPIVDPAAEAAKRLAEVQEVVRAELARQAAAQLQQPVLHADANPRVVDYRQATATPGSSTSARQGQADFYTPQRGHEVREINPDSVRRNLTNSPNQSGRDDGAGYSNQGHDLKQASASEEVNQGHDSKGHAYGTRSATKLLAAATQADSSRMEDCIQLMATTLAKVVENNQPRGQSRDQSYRRGQVSDGRYTSRERNTGGTSARTPSRNGGRDRSLSRGRDPRASTASNRDSSESASRYQSFRRSDSKSPGRASGYQKESSETRRGRSSSRGRAGETSRANSGMMRMSYPEMESGVNCRTGYNPLKEKHCTKCYPTADHHEFLCKNYKHYCMGKCSACGRGHHWHYECRDRVETFPPKVGDSNSGKLAKN